MNAMNNKVYDVLKWLVLVVVPALTTFYVALYKTCVGVYAYTFTTVSGGACACGGTIS